MITTKNSQEGGERVKTVKVAETITSYERYLQALYQRQECGEWTENIRREMQQAFFDALKSKKPLNEEMSLELLQAFRETLGGVKAELFTPHKNRGHRESTFAKDYKEDAVVYLIAVEKELIDDPKPIKTVAKAFQIHERTVKVWREKYDESAGEQLSSIQRAGMISPKTIIILLNSAGCQYRKLVPKRAKPY